MYFSFDFNVIVSCEPGTYSEARLNIKVSEVTSDLNSDSENQGRMRKRKLPSSYEEEDELETDHSSSLLPTSPKTNRWTSTSTEHPTLDLVDDVEFNFAL